MLPVQVYNMLQMEEEDHLEEIRQLNIQRRRLRDISNPFEMYEQSFIDLFRLNKEMANYVFGRIQNDMYHTANPVAIPPVLRYLAVLYFYATGSYQRTIGQCFNVAMSQQSISKCIVEVSVLIENNLRQEWIQFPTLNNMNNIKAVFMEATRFPGVIGAVDCTHVAIIAPRQEEHAYVNRKGFHSINVQLICDYNLKIRNVNARYPGSSHDSFIWRNSQAQVVLQQMHENGVSNTWLVGDSGYPQQPWLMVPILNAVEGTPEFRYTQRHRQTRNCVERCIGLLKMRFRCLLGERVLRYQPDKVGIIINVCCILHNICINAGIELDFEAQYVNEVQPNEAINLPAVNEGVAARRRLIERYFQ